ncbi:MAG: hypothetical protein H6Q20_1169 [Bacteroidetes bacterium]|jgi:FKBP-type peptidyl-prolyl cis-trans isomerase FklB|nr:hypothetical protein [Bacteroidota bacterium]
MKKQSILTIIAAVVAVLSVTSCSNYDAKEAKLSNLNDSLNYTLGLSNGGQIKSYYLTKDSSDKAIKAFIKAIDEAYKADVNKDEMYKLGQQIGGSLKQQKKIGLMGDSTLKFDEKLVLQGLINALNGHKEGMTSQQAEEYLRKIMTERQQSQMGQQAPAPQQ